MYSLQHCLCEAILPIILTATIPDSQSCVRYDMF
jgi:hypothetical protein